MTWQILTADVMDGLAQLPDASVQTVITSPPYWGLRDYGTATWEDGDAACDHLAPPTNQGGNLGIYADGTSRYKDGWSDELQTKQVAMGRPYRDRCGKCNAVRIDSQLGLEPTPEAYVEKLVGVFREIRRVLRPDGTAWLNLGDSYASTAPGTRNGKGTGLNWQKEKLVDRADWRDSSLGLKPKDLVGIPWRVAFALQADGWYLRSDIIWAKPNPMPESVTDRPTKAHEYVFLLTRTARYFYDADAVREPPGDYIPRTLGRTRNVGGRTDGYTTPNGNVATPEAGRNLRSVWSIATEPFPEAHFATFPKALVVPCVKAGTSEKGCCAECGAAFVRVREATANGQTVTVEGSARKTGLTQDNGLGDGRGSFTMKGDLIDYRTVGWVPGCTHHEADVVPCTVLDPFAGSGTVGVVALRHGRSFVGIELNPTYAEMARERIRNDAPLWNHAAELV